jgi:hypothetical protein
MALRVRTVVSALVVTFAGVLLASGFGQGPESLPIESQPFQTQDDEGDTGDPGIGSNVGDEPAYSWSPPSGTPSEEEVGDSEPEPNTSSSGATLRHGDIVLTCRNASESVTRGASSMIELTFRTAKGPMVVPFETPVSTPAANNRPWTIVVRFNGRPSNIYGEDPVEALEMATWFVQSYLSDMEGLDPAVRPPTQYQAEPPEPPQGTPSGQGEGKDD